MFMILPLLKFHCQRLVTMWYELRKKMQFQLYNEPCTTHYTTTSTMNAQLILNDGTNNSYQIPMEQMSLLTCINLSLMMTGGKMPLTDDVCTNTNYFICQYCEFLNARFHRAISQMIHIYTQPHPLAKYRVKVPSGIHSRP